MTSHGTISPSEINESLHRLKSFNLTEEHVKLLANYSFYWPLESVGHPFPGGPYVNQSLPYGDVCFEEEIADILGWTWEHGSEGRSPMPEELRTLARMLHAQTAVALQVVLQAGSFEPGLYVRDTIEERLEKWRRA